MLSSIDGWRKNSNHAGYWVYSVLKSCAKMERMTKGRMVVLVVEDSRADALLAQIALERADASMELHLVQDGQAAIDFVHRQSPRPDLILLDLNLPRKSGDEVLRDLKSDPAYQDIPIVILGGGSRRMVLRPYGLDANGQVPKSADFDELCAVLASTVEYWRRAVVLPPR